MRSNADSSTGTGRESRAREEVIDGSFSAFAANTGSIFRLFGVI